MSEPMREIQFDTSLTCNRCGIVDKTMFTENTCPRATQVGLNVLLTNAKMRNTTFPAAEFDSVIFCKEEGVPVVVDAAALDSSFATARAVLQLHVGDCATRFTAYEQGSSADRDRDGNFVPPRTFTEDQVKDVLGQTLNIEAN